MFKLLARCFLRLAGWKVEGEKPPFRHYVMVAAPHTSNWDFVYMLAMATSLDIKPRWIGKHTMFRWPFGGLMRLLGGISVNRSAPGGMVKKVTTALKTDDEVALLIPPEGTRSLRSHWKSGFYRIAKSANVPIVLTFLDFRRKVGGIGPSFVPSDDVIGDMDIVRKFYTDKQGRYPNLFSTPVLKEEQQTSSSEVSD